MHVRNIEVSVCPSYRKLETIKINESWPNSLRSTCSLSFSWHHRSCISKKVVVYKYTHVEGRHCTCIYTYIQCVNGYNAALCWYLIVM